MRPRTGTGPSPTCSSAIRRSRPSGCGTTKARRRCATTRSKTTRRSSRESRKQVTTRGCPDVSMSERTEPAGAPADTLLVASTGGHLEELERLSRRIEPASRGVAWATFDDEQSRSLLAGQQVHTVEFVPPRGYLPAIRNLRAAWQILRDGQFTRVVSTGAGVAIPFLLLGRLRRIECHYIESAARSLGPSLT